MSKVVIYDYEVFRFDTLLGCIVIYENGKEEIYQTWDLAKISQFYNEHKTDLWIGHNNFEYDDYITNAVVSNKNTYEVSKQLISKQYYDKMIIKLLSMDLMRLSSDTYSLKLTELLCGKNIHESEIDFDLPRKLTDEEKKIIENYNLDDLDQTIYNYKKMYDLVKLRLDLIKEFKLEVYSNLKAPGYLLAANVLNAKYNAALKYKKREPILYRTLKIENKKVLDFYLSEKYKEKDDFIVNICDLDVNLGGQGGAHGAIKKAFEDKVKYIDVSGFYNLLAILYDLLPRNLSAEAKEKYKLMYQQQLALKKINPAKREAYKVILLAVIGSMELPNSPFYDPESYKLLTVLGKMFIYDLLEKLDGKIRLIQVNTDGLMLVPKDWSKEKEIDDIINEWVKRTGFNVKNEYLYRLIQKDVNTYCCVDENNEVIYKGTILKNYDIGDKAYGSQKFFKCVEPPIIAQGIINFLIYGIDPEDFVNSVKKDLKLFQYACRKGQGADYLTYETCDLRTFERSCEKLQGVDRVFALKSKNILGEIYKYKGNSYGKQSKKLYPSLPGNVFVYNYSLDNAYEEIGNQIDYEYYINRICEKIRDFI